MRGVKMYKIKRFKKVARQPGSNGQLYVRVPASDWAKIFSWLNKHGYRNVHGFTAEQQPPYGVIVIEKERYFGTNVTCMACAVSCGDRTVSFDEFLALKDTL